MAVLKVAAACAPLPAVLVIPVVSACDVRLVYPIRHSPAKDRAESEAAPNAAEPGGWYETCAVHHRASPLNCRSAREYRGCTDLPRHSIRGCKVESAPEPFALRLQYVNAATNPPRTSRI